MSTRSYCRQPERCVAGRRGRCALCQPLSDGTRARMSAAKKASWADPKVRARMSAAYKAAWADPKVRARMSAACKAAWADPEVRARNIAGRKADALDCHVALSKPFRDRAKAFAAEHGLSQDLAEDALVLMEDDDLDVASAIAAAFAYAGRGALSEGRGA